MEIRIMDLMWMHSPVVSAVEEFTHYHVNKCRWCIIWWVGAHGCPHAVEDPIYFCTRPFVWFWWRFGRFCPNKYLSCYMMVIFSQNVPLNGALHLWTFKPAQRLGCVSLVIIRGSGGWQTTGKELEVGNTGKKPQVKLVPVTQGGAVEGDGG